MDYISVEYNDKKRPQTSYPAKLAEYIFVRSNLRAGQTILEVGSGRSELLEHFKRMGLETYAIDSANSAAEFANKAGANFEHYNLSPENFTKPFNEKKFDIIFSKSFIEHLYDPLYFFNWCHGNLNELGKLISLTPDWVSNHKGFYDDITHVKPFTKVSMNQSLELACFSDIKVFTFRQLPMTWNNKLVLQLSKLTYLLPYSPHKVKQKWFRWSKELMIYSEGVKTNK
jgi:2-polyprenyl-3-methyl-5-hydroxy-6-metoxy-1,4-benzoquinol methylase